MKIDFRAVFVKLHAHLQMQEGVKNETVSATAKAHRLLLEGLVQQALVNEFLEASTKVQGTDGPSLMKELLNGPCKSEGDLDT